MLDQGLDETTPRVGAEGSQATTAASLPRLLRPFATSAYRRLAASLVLSSFAYVVWVVAQVWEVIRIGGGPDNLHAFGRDEQP